MKKDEITCYFSGNIGTAVRKLTDGFFDEIQEIRLRGTPRGNLRDFRYQGFFCGKHKKHQLGKFQDSP